MNLQPLTTIVFGLLLVVFDLNLGTIDVIPDLLGWGFVFAGLSQLRPKTEQTSVLMLLALVLGAWSVGVMAISTADRLYGNPWIATAGGLLYAVFVWMLVSYVLSQIGDDHPKAPPLALMRNVVTIATLVSLLVGLLTRGSAVALGGGATLILLLLLATLGCYLYLLILLWQCASFTPAAEAESQLQG